MAKIIRPCSLAAALLAGPSAGANAAEYASKRGCLAGGLPRALDDASRLNGRAPRPWPIEFMNHCSTNWAAYPAEVESGPGGAAALRRFQRGSQWVGLT